MLSVSQLREVSHRLGGQVGPLACTLLQVQFRKGFAKGKKPGADDEDYGKDTTTQQLLKVTPTTFDMFLGTPRVCIPSNTIHPCGIR